MSKHLLKAGLIVLVLLILAPASAALAHGEPVIALAPDVAAAGGRVTVTGSEMEPGEVFAISLEGLGTPIPLGQATATGEGKEGASLPSSPSRRTRHLAFIKCGRALRTAMWQQAN